MGHGTSRFLASPAWCLQPLMSQIFNTVYSLHAVPEYGLSESNRAVVSVYLEEGTKRDIRRRCCAGGWQTCIQTSGGEIVVVPGKLGETLLQKGKTIEIGR